MRKILTIFFFIPLFAGATNSYFAAAGLDSHAGTQAAPYQTYAKFNSVMASANPGDSIFFNRGDAFPGFLRFPRSGSSGNPIFVGTYGTGAEPIISGLINVTLSGSGPNYTGTATGATALTTLFVIDGQLAAWSQSPNVLTGYWIYNQAISSTTTIVDPVHAPSITTGMKLFVRSSPYTIDNVTVTGVTSTTITFSPALTYNNVGANGYCIQGNTPDSANEVTYSGGVSGTLTVNQPEGIAGHTYQVPGTDTVIYITGSHIVISGLNIQGGNVAGVYVAFQTAADITLSQDSIMYCMDGIFNRGCSGVTVLNCTIDHCLDNGIFREDPTYFWSVLTDAFNDIGMHPGNGLNGQGHYQAVNYATGDSVTVITGCTADSIGGGGFNATGRHSRVDSNYLSYYGQILADCGGIYHWTNSGTPDSGLVLNNVCVHGGGSLSQKGVVSATISDVVFGIYLDGTTAGMLVSGNTMAYNSSSGSFNKGVNNTLVNGTYYGNGYSDHLMQEAAGQVVTGQVLKHNIFTSPVAVRYITVGNDLSTIGVSDTNAVVALLGTAVPFYTQSSVDGGTFRTQASWTSNTGNDAHSSLQIGVPVFVYNICQTSCSFPAFYKYKGTDGTAYSGTITVPGLSSLVILNIQVGYLLKRRGHKVYYN